MMNNSNNGGFALITSLLMLALTGILGLTVMKSSSNDYKASTDQEMEKNTFSVAEAAAIDAYNTLEPGTLTSGEIRDLDIESTDNRLQVSVTARQDGTLPAVNSSLSLFGLISYSIRGTATNTDANTQRSITLGSAQRTPIQQ